MLISLTATTACECGPDPGRVSGQPRPTRVAPIWVGDESWSRSPSLINMVSTQSRVVAVDDLTEAVQDALAAHLFGAASAARAPPGAQRQLQLRPQLAACLQEQRLVDRLVGHVHPRIVGMVLFQSARDLLRREVIPQFFRDRVVQSLIFLQLPRFRPSLQRLVPLLCGVDLAWGGRRTAGADYKSTPTSTGADVRSDRSRAADSSSWCGCVVVVLSGVRPWRARRPVAVRIGLLARYNHQPRRVA